MGTEGDAPSMRVFLLMAEPNEHRLVNEVLRVHAMLYPSSPYYARPHPRRTVYGAIDISAFDWMPCVRHGILEASG